ncbi:hypothetical protein CPB85DRAFT_1276374 [Mucidula mucida]|nr:hypothetical protein CPB85DRAFT_1276374 [Mucidula mucida]
MNRASCLCPGYTQVDEFDPEDEYEEEEEEVSYVVLDLENVDPSLIPSSSTYRLLCLSGTVLKGVHDSMLGTELIFTEDKGAQPQLSPSQHALNIFHRKCRPGEKADKLPRRQWTTRLL